MKLSFPQKSWREFVQKNEQLLFRKMIRSGIIVAFVKVRGIIVAFVKVRGIIVKIT